jgi:hypothetical protein
VHREGVTAPVVAPAKLTGSLNGTGTNEAVAVSWTAPSLATANLGHAQPAMPSTRRTDTETLDTNRVTPTTPEESGRCCHSDYQMSHRVSAIVRWRSSQGRQYLPTGGRLVTVAKFPEDSDWHRQAWSVVIETSTPPDALGAVRAQVSFLVARAPMIIAEGCRVRAH